MDKDIFRFELLKLEIEMINKKINHFDNLRIRTRQLSIVAWCAIIGFALKEELYDLFLLGTLLPLPFWYIDAVYRSYYLGWESRLYAIRTFVREGEIKIEGKEDARLEDFLSPDKECSFPDFDYWGTETIPEKQHSKKTKLSKSIYYPSVIVIYGSMIFLTILFYLFK